MPPPVKRSPHVSATFLDRHDGAKRYAVLRWTENGQRRSETLGYVSPREAEERRADREAALRLGVSLPNSVARGPTTVDDLCANYLEVLEEGSGRGSERYRRHELLHCKRIGAHLGTRPADALTIADVRRLVQRAQAEEPEASSGVRSRDRNRLRGLRKKSSVVDMLGCLGRVYREGQLVKLCTIEAPPFQAGDLADDDRPSRRITEAEVAALAAAATARSPTLGRLVRFLAWCPRRPVAIFGLRRRDCARVLDPDVARDDVLLYFARDKGGKRRGWSPITEPALEALREHLAASEGGPEDLVWPSPRGRPYDTSLLAAAFRRAAEEAKLRDVVPYDLRKFGASRVYRAANGNLKVVMEFTGHADIQQLVTVYVHAEQGEAEALAGRVQWTPAPLRLVKDEGGSG